jgi:hypothetical protein
MSAGAKSPVVVMVVVVVTGLALGCSRARDEQDLRPPPGFVPPPVRPLVKNPAGAGRIGYGAGFYLQEVGAAGETWRWMAARGEVRLRNDGRARRLRLAGWIPLEYTHQPSRIRISVEGHALDDFVQTAREFDKRYVVQPAVLGSAPSVVLVIETDRTIVAPGDTRPLGLSVETLGWDAD